ncbi:MAG: extracellular solute-binding protein [Clostridia bacterium]|nr:extracellular solute-binding protein [Clostridia bacterium]
MVNKLSRKSNLAKLLLMLLMALALTGAACAEGTALTAQEYQDIVSTYSINDAIPGYADYLEQHEEAVRPEIAVTVEADAYVRYEDAGVTAEPRILTDYEGGAGNAVLTGEESLVEWKVSVPESGLYDLSILYYPYEGKNSAIQRAFFIDGKLPYGELALVEFNRVWHNGDFAEMVDDNGITVRNWDKDNQGNDLKPSAEEIPEWVIGRLYDSNGYIAEEMSVYLEAGEHTLTLLAMREPMLLRSITLQNTDRPAAYADVKAAGDAAGQKDVSGVTIRFEAENAGKTSSQMLYPVQDQSSAAVYPASTRYLLNNSIGGNSWKNAGQWIEWTFEVPEDGYYALSMYDKQNFVRGINVFRKIYIDGAVPFAEFQAYPFGYEQSWRMETIADENGEPYRVYLTAGQHTLRMEVVLGDMATIIAQVQDCVQQLNDIYRQVIYITGVAPDQYRDYQLEASLPELEGQLIQVKADLGVALSALEATAGTNSDKLTVLRTMDDQLDELIEDQERFTEVLSSYKTNVRACGNWITQVLGQPLQIDRIYVHAADVKPVAEGSDWWSGLKHEVTRLYYSFIIDYNQVGNVADESGDGTVLTLWIGTGRDQANVIKALIDEKFTPNTGISVNVQLVDMNTLLRATLSGQGPDVAIQVANTNGIAGAVLNTGNDTPVNYGLREAVLDLTQFEDFKEVAARFDDSALVPFSFNGATYALPDTQTFPMMFYRKDILAEIGLAVPSTWDEVKVAMSILAKNQMEFGMLPSEQIFAMLLFQNGGSYYTANADASALDDDLAINVFKKYCEYYTDYKLDKATSVEERFRTGECPIIISDYTTYNNLQVSAPDIVGLWDFTTVPGTVQADGSINRATGASGLADIIMSATEYPDEAWEFLKWWTDAETQTLYGREMESLMGASARVATANKEALANLSWPMKDYKALVAQMEQVQGIPQVPGGYYTWRNINNAFYDITTNTATNNTTPREALMDKIYYINAEISYKRAEFGLPVADDTAEEE